MSSLNKERIRLGILISGRGSNMQAIYEATQNKTLNAEVSVVISNQPEAKGVEFARSKGISCHIFQPGLFSSNTDYEKEIVKTLIEHNVDLVILAGYMKIVGQEIISNFNNKIMNIHPSLLPSFTGLHAQKQAVEYGVKFSGCTVHFVDDTLDGGPIILQHVVPVLPEDTEESLSSRILEKEHQLYPQAIQLFSENKLKIQDRQVIILPS